MMNAEWKTPRAGALRISFIILHSALCILFSLGCERNDMHNQPRHEPHEPSAFFADGQSSRPLVAGTVARGQLVSNDMRYFGLATEGETPADTFPFEITKADLIRGQQRYNIYCSVCHGADGDGNGMIVQRGFTRPPSLHEQRLKDAPAGHFFNVITNGWGAMYSYNDRIFPEDRWRIIAYVRTLQLSQAQAVASAAMTTTTTSQQPARPDGATGTRETPGGREARDDVDAVRRAVQRVSGGGGGPVGGAGPQDDEATQGQGDAVQRAVERVIGGGGGTSPQGAEGTPGQGDAVQRAVERVTGGAAPAVGQNENARPQQPPTGARPEPGDQQ